MGGGCFGMLPELKDFVVCGLMFLVCNCNVGAGDESVRFIGGSVVGLDIVVVDDNVVGRCIGTVTLVLVVSAGEGFEDEEAAVEAVVVVVAFVWFLLPLEEGEDGGDRTLCCLLFRGIDDIVSTVSVKSFPLSLEN